MSSFKIQRHLPVNRTTDLSNPKELNTYKTRLRQAAGLYEKHFLREMVKAMRSTITHSELTKPGMAENIYQQKIDEQYVENWGNKGGVGLANQIYEQLMARDPRFSEMGIPSGPLPVNKKRGPLPIPEASEVPIKIQKSDSELGKQTSLSFESPSGLLGEEVHSPWAGRVTEAFSHKPNESVVTVDHGDNLFSRLVFKGEALGELAGRRVEKGEVLGRQVTQDQGLHWHVQQRRV